MSGYKPFQGRSTAVIDHRPATPQLLDKDGITQPLRRAQIALAAGQTDGIVRRGFGSFYEAA